MSVASLDLIGPENNATPPSPRTRGSSRGATFVPRCSLPGSFDHGSHGAGDGLGFGNGASPPAATGWTDASAFASGAPGSIPCSRHRRGLTGPGSLQVRLVQVLVPI